MHVQMTIGTDRVSNPGPLTYVSGALPTALRGPAIKRTGICPYSLNANVAGSHLARVNYIKGKDPSFKRHLAKAKF